MSVYDKARAEAVRRLIENHSTEYKELFEKVKMEFGIVPISKPYNPLTTPANAARKQIRLNHIERFNEIYKIEKTKYPVQIAYGKALSALVFEFSKEYRELYDYYAFVAKG